MKYLKLYIRLNFKEGTTLLDSNTMTQILNYIINQRPPSFYTIEYYEYIEQNHYRILLKSYQSHNTTAWTNAQGLQAV